MIGSFRHRGLADLYLENNSRRVNPDLVARCKRRLSVMEAAESLTDLRVAGFDFHRLHGVPVRYSIHVNGPWTITFEWADGAAWRIDLEQYH
jgi:proteic killer suppression protein